MKALENDDDRNLLIQIAAKSKHLDSLTIEDVNLLTEIFHLQKNDNEKDAFHKLRNKLCEILIIEREHYQDYLKLPKFKRLRIQTIDTITLFWEFIWLTFVHTKEEQKGGGKTLLQMNGVVHNGMTSSLGCYNYFPAYQPMNQPKLPFSPYPYFYNFHNYQIPQFYPNTSNLKYTPFQLPKPPFNTLQTEPPHNTQPSFKIERQSDSDNKNNNSQSQPQSQSQNLNQNQNQPQNQSQSQNIISIQFLNCVCEGKNTEQNQQQYSCNECRNYYHLGCIKIKKAQSRYCPLCTLTKNNIFAQPAGRMIKTGWLSLCKQELFVTKIHFNEDEMKLFSLCLSNIQNTQQNKSAWIQFNILKISDAAANKKSNKTSFIISLSQLKKLESRKWIEVKLRQINIECLAFYMISLTKIKQVESIVSYYKSMIKEKDVKQLWAEQERKEKKKLSISLLHPITKRLIELPVRGEFCTHLECEDLLYFYHTFKSSRLDKNCFQCSHCKRVYSPHSKFISDHILYQMIEGREKESKSHRIQMGQKGELEWTVFDGKECQNGQEMLDEGDEMESEV